MKATLTILIVLCAASVGAQPTAIDKPVHILPPGMGRNVVDAISWGTAIANVAADAKVSCIDAVYRRSGCLKLAGRVGVTYGAVYAVKFLVHRKRPCAPDCGIDDPDKSFYSAHTAIAFEAIGGPRLSITLPLASATGVGRMFTKHWLTDVGAGALAGYAISYWR